MSLLIHKVLSYCKSHIYELHAVLAAMITFAVMFPIKKPLKRKLAKWVERKAAKNESWKQHKTLYKKRVNIIVLFIAVVLSYAIFSLISLISPLIYFSWITAFLSAVFTLNLYALYEQIFGGESNGTY